jgi:hypothetical protein
VILHRHDFANVGDYEALVRVEVRPALRMGQLFDTAVGLAEQGRTDGHLLSQVMPAATRLRPYSADGQHVVAALRQPVDDRPR